MIKILLLLLFVGQAIAEEQIEQFSCEKIYQYVDDSEAGRMRSIEEVNGKSYIDECNKWFISSSEGVDVEISNHVLAKEINAQDPNMEFQYCGVLNIFLLMNYNPMNQIIFNKNCIFKIDHDSISMENSFYRKKEYIYTIQEENNENSLPKYAYINSKKKINDISGKYVFSHAMSNIYCDGKLPCFKMVESSGIKEINQK